MNAKNKIQNRFGIKIQNFRHRINQVQARAMLAILNVEKVNLKDAKSSWNAKILPAMQQKTPFLSLLKLIAKNSLNERANAHRSQIMCKDSNHPLYNQLVSNPNSHSIETSISHDDTHFTLTPIELIKDSGEPLLNTFERLKRESYWMVLIGTIKPYGLNTKSVNFEPILPRNINHISRRFCHLWSHSLKQPI